MKLVCIPQSTIYHVGGATLPKNNPRKTFLNFRNNLLMIYKNASSQQLRKILFWRRILDYVAIIHILITGNRKDAYAIYQARKEFHKLLPEFTDVRKENLSKTTNKDIPEMLQSSILWKYYVQRKRTYSSL
jgi:GT2 family glycosyltransferase